jgi:hypothetical protein
MAAGAVPLASRLRFRSANAIETAARAVPIAPVTPKTFRAFGGARIDNYDWLRDRKDPRVIAYSMRKMPMPTSVLSRSSHWSMSLPQN